MTECYSTVRLSFKIVPEFMCIYKYTLRNKGLDLFLKGVQKLVTGVDKVILCNFSYRYIIAL